MVRFEIDYTFVSQASNFPYTTVFDAVPKYENHGGNIPGVVVHATNGITLPAGTYLFRQLPRVELRGWDNPREVRRHYSSGRVDITNYSVPVGNGSLRRHVWWRWTGEAGHATERVDGDVVWPMARPSVFTFASAKTIKAHTPNWNDDVASKSQDPPKTTRNSLLFKGMIERL